MRLYLVRHGQTAWNAEMRAQGHADIPLDEVGRRQAELLADAIADLQVALILSSDLQRAAQTAKILADRLAAPLVLDPRLRERSFGKMEGLSFKQLAATLHQQQHIEGTGPYDVRPAGGESLRDAWQRVRPVAEELSKRTDGDVIVVGHGASCALLLAHLFRGQVETSRAFRFGNTGLTETIRRPEGNFQLIRYNDVSHLESERPLTGTVDGSSR
jgi:2,3-bisphosphoglycerate-dependent phosphoglycerate mutase